MTGYTFWIVAGACAFGGLGAAALVWIVYVCCHPPLCELCGRSWEIFERGHFLCLECRNGMRDKARTMIEHGATREQVAEVLQKIEEREREASQ